MDHIVTQTGIQVRPPHADNPLDVAVVVPMHNAERTIGAALASIRAQTRPPAAVVVVDDASSDNSVAVATACAPAGFVLVALSRNRGPGGARNAGAAAASTTWVAFLDADDVWMETFLEETYGAVEATDADFAGTGGIREMLRRSPIVRNLNAPPTGSDRTNDFWRMAARFMPIVPSCALIRRSLYEQVGGFPEDARSGEDVTFFAELWLHGRFAFVNKPLYKSWQREGGLTAGPRSYRDTGLFTVRLGRTLVRAALRRKPGTRWFLIAYVRRVARRHVTWFGSLIKTQR